MANLRRRGFTLIELLFLIVVFVILMGLLIPAVLRVREGSIGGNRGTCINNLKQLGISAHAFHSGNKRFPPGIDGLNMSCLLYLLPYLEKNRLYQEIQTELTLAPDTVWSEGSAKMLDLATEQSPTFLCPSDPVWPGTVLVTGSVLVANSSNAGPTLVTIGPAAKTSIYGRTNYTGVAGVGGSGHGPGINKPAGIDLQQFEGIFTKLSRITVADITDGTSNTLLFGEGLGGSFDPRDTQWTWMGVGSVSTWGGLADGVQVASSATNFSSAHGGIVQFCFADGSVRSLRIGTTATAPFGTAGEWYILQQLAGMRDGTKIDDSHTLLNN